MPTMKMKEREKRRRRGDGEEVGREEEEERSSWKARFSLLLLYLQHLKQVLACVDIL